MFKEWRLQLNVTRLKGDDSIAMCDVLGWRFQLNVVTVWRYKTLEEAPFKPSCNSQLHIRLLLSKVFLK